ncbi:MAG TPA: hypothetical protein VGN17_00350 [Bryobacteraceae bacterium]
MEHKLTQHRQALDSVQRELPTLEAALTMKRNAPPSPIEDRGAIAEPSA